MLGKLAVRVNDFFRWWEFNKKFLRYSDPWRYQTTVHEQNRFQVMERAIQDRRYEQALEIGCYQGLFSERLLALTRDLTCLDISPVALKRCRRRLEAVLGSREWASRGGRWRPQVEYVRANFRSWDPLPKRYDLIVMGDVFYYLEPALKLRKHFGEAIHSTLPDAARRVVGWLKPGGRMLMTHGFGCAEQYQTRQEYRDLFVSAGLRVLKEELGEASDKGGSRIFLNLFEKPEE